MDRMALKRKIKQFNKLSRELSRYTLVDKKGRYYRRIDDIHGPFEIPQATCKLTVISKLYLHTEDYTNVYTVALLTKHLIVGCQRLSLRTVLSRLRRGMLCYDRYRISSRSAKRLLKWIEEHQCQRI